MLHSDPGDGLVGHVSVKVVVRIIVGRFNGAGVLYDCRSPLTGVAADETIKVFETKSDRPEIKWTVLAGVPLRDIVVFV